MFTIAARVLAGMDVCISGGSPTPLSCYDQLFHDEVTICADNFALMGGFQAAGLSKEVLPVVGKWIRSHGLLKAPLLDFDPTIQPTRINPDGNCFFGFVAALLRQ